MVQKNKKLDSTDYSYFSFTDQDQREQLQIFVDWLHSQRVGEATGCTPASLLNTVLPLELRKADVSRTRVQC